MQIDWIDIAALAILFGIMIFFATVCHWLAKWKGRKPAFWGALGLMFGPLPIPVILLVRKKKRILKQPT